MTIGIRLHGDLKRAIHQQLFSGTKLLTSVFPVSFPIQSQLVYQPVSKAAILTRCPKMSMYLLTNRSALNDKFSRMLNLNAQHISYHFGENIPHSEMIFSFSQTPGKVMKFFHALLLVFSLIN